MSWALELLSFANRPDMEWVVEYSQLHTSSTVLASIATALTALAAVETLDGEDTAQLTRLLRSFACFLKKYRGAIAVCADQCLANPETSLLIVGPRAVTTICKHLVKLPSQGPLLGNRDLYNETQVLLSELCSKRDEEPFVKARRHLRRLRAALVSPRNQEMS